MCRAVGGRAGLAWGCMVKSHDAAWQIGEEKIGEEGGHGHDNYDDDDDDDDDDVSNGDYGVNDAYLFVFPRPLAKCIIQDLLHRHIASFATDRMPHLPLLLDEVVMVLVYDWDPRG